jgi:multidrug efflux pump subunit AcrA (membrane-fusion protein)
MNKNISLLELKPMKKYTKISLTLFVLSMLMLSACSAINIGNTPEPEETEVPVLQADFGTITEGRLVPNEFVNLSFKTGGQVNELLFEEGDTVSQGDVIARLGNREQLEVAVANAELEMLSAEQALDVLYDNAEVNTALAMQAITDALDAKRDAERYLTNLNAQPSCPSWPMRKKNIITPCGCSITCRDQPVNLTWLSPKPICPSPKLSWR